MIGQKGMRCLCANARQLHGVARPLRTVERASLLSQRRILQSRIAIRHAFNSAGGPKPKGMDKLRQAYKEHPILLPMGFVCVFASFCFLGYVNYLYFIQAKAMHHFPEPVAKELRKAIYYDKGYGRDPKKAFQHYKEALLVATDIAMNPYSEEFIGMRIRMGEFLEEHGQIDGAITVVEKERDLAYDFLKREQERTDLEIPDAMHARMVGMAVKLGVKLGKLYAHEDVDDHEEAQAALIMAVETLLKERIRRQEKGIKEEAKEWLNEEEVGATLEELAHTYIDSRQPELALPLYLQALSLAPSRSCHTAMLMNQVSAAVSEQQPAIAAALMDNPKSKSKQSIPTAADLQKQAKQWGEKALQMAQAIQPPERTEECDIACAVTTHNLAELASLAGDMVTAKRLFQEAKTISKAMNFEDGVKEATIALERLQDPTKP